MLFLPRAILIAYAAFQVILVSLHALEQPATVWPRAVSVGLVLLLTLAAFRRVRFTARTLTVFMGFTGLGGLVQHAIIAASGDPVFLLDQPMPLL